MVEINISFICLIASVTFLMSNVSRAGSVTVNEPVSNHTVGKPNDPSRWDRYLTGTYWYVPTNALPAQFHRASSILPVEQQTVYFIESSKRGVFTGWMVT